jgi:hypothetical protein
VEVYYNKIFKMFHFEIFVEERKKHIITMFNYKGSFKALARDALSKSLPYI